MEKTMSGTYCISELDQYILTCVIYLYLYSKSVQYAVSQLKSVSNERVQKNCKVRKSERYLQAAYRLCQKRCCTANWNLPKIA